MPAPARRGLILGVRPKLFILTLCLALTGVSAPALAQSPAGDGAEPIAVGAGAPSDAAVAERIAEVFDQLPEMAGVEVSVEAGVVRLSGSAPNIAAVERAGEIAGRVDGVAAVRNEIERDLDVTARVRPAVDTLNTRTRAAVAALPLLAAALVTVLIAIVLAWLLRRWVGLWRRVTPNPFVAELVAGIVQLVVIGLGVVLALMLLDATALLTAALGAAGVLGLAVGFAVRDVIENYLASVLLSLRQPFRPLDHVVINGHEGRVARLTSRATILVTLEGNHLRIPNAEVFKATILNYTRNPQRRLSFDLGIGAEDDPLAAISAAADVLAAKDFVLADPPPGGRIKNVGESNIVIEFWAWIDQSRSDFYKSRTAALAAVKAHLEAGGFALPEPIYRLRWDSPPPAAALDAAAAAPAPKPKAPPPSVAAADQNTAPDASLERFVAEERADPGEQDLLTEHGPVE